MRTTLRGRFDASAHTAAIVLVALAIALAASLPTTRETRAASANWAWVVVRQTSGSHTPAGRDQANSSGAVNSVTDLSVVRGPGAYRIDLPDVGPNPDEHGSVLVSTLGSQPRICTPQRWDVTNDDVGVIVLCYTRTGMPAPAAFVLNWLAASGVGGRLAYATDASPGGKCYPPSAHYHSLGSTILSCDEAGLATLFVPDLGGSGGHIQVSALARRAGPVDEPTAAYCGVASLSPTKPQVACFDAAGVQQLSRGYQLSFMDGLGLKGIVRRSVAYLLADHPKRASYLPRAADRYSSSDRPPKVERLRKGRYLVTFTGMPKGGSAQVTPVAAKDGAGTWVPRHCVITSIAATLPQRVGVRCFQPSGAPADSRFLLSYAK